MSGSYHGSPVQIHLSLPIECSHFDRWLALLEETATNLCPPDAAEHFVERARRVADSIELEVTAQQGRIQNPSYQTARRIHFKTEAQSDKRSEWNPITSIGVVS
jgi:hemoglobin